MVSFLGKADMMKQQEFRMIKKTSNKTLVVKDKIDLDKSFENQKSEIIKKSIANTPSFVGNSVPNIEINNFSDKNQEENKSTVVKSPYVSDPKNYFSYNESDT
jgi:hypothetical protein